MLWLEEHHIEAVPADRYTLTSTDSITGVASLSHVDNALRTPQTFDPVCCSQSGNNASSSSQALPDVSTPLTAKSATPASSASNVTPSGSSASRSSRTLPGVTTSLTAKSVTPASSASSVSHSESSAAGSSRTHPSVTTPSSAKSASSGDGTDESILSQLLPSLPTVTSSLSSSTKQGCACVLTSKNVLN